MKCIHKRKRLRKRKLCSHREPGKQLMPDREDQEKKVHLPLGYFLRKLHTPSLSQSGFVSAVSWVCCETWNESVLTSHCWSERQSKEAMESVPVFQPFPDLWDKKSLESLYWGLLDKQVIHPPGENVHSEGLIR